DTDCHAFFNQATGRKIYAVAKSADTERSMARRSLARQWAPHQDSVNSPFLQLFDRLRGDQLVLSDDYISGPRVRVDVTADTPPRVVDRLAHSFAGPAVVAGDDDSVDRVDEPAHQVTSIASVEWDQGQLLPAGSEELRRL